MIVVGGESGEEVDMGLMVWLLLLLWNWLRMNLGCMCWMRLKIVIGFGIGSDYHHQTLQFGHV